MLHGGVHSERLRASAAAAALLALSFLFWLFRIYRSGVNPAIEIGPVDLYIEHIPAVQFGLEALRDGAVRLWNPYQFCGTPFLAMGWIGLLYPPHLLGLWLDDILLVEVMFVFHMFLGGVGMWGLARHYGISRLGALCAATTYIWSGLIILDNILPALFQALNLMPLAVLCTDRVMQGRRLAWLWFSLVVGNLMLLGAIEVAVHVLYACALFAACRVTSLVWQGHWRLALRHAALLGAALATAGMIAAVLLFPSTELTRQSARAAGTLTLAQALYPGSIRPLIFLTAALEAAGVVTVGVLPLFALPLGAALRRCRLPWIGSVIAAVLGAALAFGEPVYRYYYMIPVVGGLFRRPMKFLDIYSCGQALLCGIAVTQLGEWAGQSVRDLWRRAGWWLALTLAAAAIVWLALQGKVNWFLAAACGLLLLFGGVRPAAVRRGLLAALCAVQAASLFFVVGDTHVRPLARPEIYRSDAEVFEFLKRNAGYSRTYLSPRFWFWPGLTAKQGALQRVFTVTDYEPLAPGRYREFFEYLSEHIDPPFAGAYYLDAKSRYRLMDLTGTKYYVMLRGEPGDLYMAQSPAAFQLRYEKPFLRVYERTAALPRAYFVTQARRMDEPHALLAELDRVSFDPQAEILLEGDAPPPPLPADTEPANERVKIVSYEPERVVVAADVKSSGYLVLTDLLYPGWKAFVADREVPLERANYLFRAVRLSPGSWDVRFEYQPDSWRWGLRVSLATAVLLLVLALALWYRRRLHTGNR